VAPLSGHLALLLCDVSQITLAASHGVPIAEAVPASTLSAKPLGMTHCSIGRRQDRIDSEESCQNSGFSVAALATDSMKIAANAEP
jgi:hypothetical protein